MAWVISKCETQSHPNASSWFCLLKRPKKAKKVGDKSHILGHTYIYPLFIGYSMLQYVTVLFLEGSSPDFINGRFRNLNWSYLPFVWSLCKGIFGISPKLWPAKMLQQYYSTSNLRSCKSHRYDKNPAFLCLEPLSASSRGSHGIAIGYLVRPSEGGQQDQQPRNALRFRYIYIYIHMYIVSYIVILCMYIVIVI